MKVQTFMNALDINKSTSTSRTNFCKKMKYGGGDCQWEEKKSTNTEEKIWDTKQ